MSGAGEAPQPPGSGPWDLASGRSTHARGPFEATVRLSRSGLWDPASGISRLGGIIRLGRICAWGDLRSLGGSRAGIGATYTHTVILCLGEATSRLASSGPLEPASGISRLRGICARGGSVLRGICAPAHWIQPFRGEGSSWTGVLGTKWNRPAWRFS